MSITSTGPGKRRGYRWRSLAGRYDVTIRTAERMVADGRLPRPDFYLGRLPIWTDETLDAADALRARKPVAEASATTTA
jgi:hypothetical protein